MIVEIHSQHFAITPEPQTEELKAAIIAAVGAMLESGTYRLNVRPFTRIYGHAPVWNTAGRRENHDSRKML